MCKMEGCQYCLCAEKLVSKAGTTVTISPAVKLPLDSCGFVYKEMVISGRKTLDVTKKIYFCPMCGARLGPYSLVDYEATLSPNITTSELIKKLKNLPLDQKVFFVTLKETDDDVREL